MIIGILEAGGGFLIIPTSVLLMNFKIQNTVLTSLFIIILNSLIGFLSDKHDFLIHDWVNIFNYLGLSVLGMMIGINLTTYINPLQLKKGFGWFVFVTAIAILVREFII